MLESVILESDVKSKSTGCHLASVLLQHKLLALTSYRPIKQSINKHFIVPPVRHGRRRLQ